jgi:hypothetical protein
LTKGSLHAKVKADVRDDIHTDSQRNHRTIYRVEDIRISDKREKTQSPQGQTMSQLQDNNRLPP